MRVEEEGAFVGDPVEVGRFDEFVDCAFAGLVAVGAGVPAPVIRESENDVWSHGFFSGLVILSVVDLATCRCLTDAPNRHAADYMATS